MTFFNSVEEQIVSRAGHIWGLKGFRTEINLASHSRQAAAKCKNIFFGEIFKDFYFQEEKSSCPTTAPAGKGKSWKLSSFLKFDFETNRLAAIFE